MRVNRNTTQNTIQSISYQNFLCEKKKFSYLKSFFGRFIGVQTLNNSMECGYILKKFIINNNFFIFVSLIIMIIITLVPWCIRVENKRRVVFNGSRLFLYLLECLMKDALHSILFLHSFVIVWLPESQTRRIY